MPIVKPTANDKSIALGRFGLGISLLFLLLPFAAIPPLRSGFFTQIENLTALLWFCGGLAALWNVLLLKTHPRLTRCIWSLPLVWTSLPLVLYAALHSLTLSTPLMIWAGSPQLLEGIFTFMSLMFLSIPLLIFSKKAPCRWLFSAVTFAAGITLSIFAVLGSNNTIPAFRSFHLWEWAPLFFPDFIAFFIPVYIILLWRLKSDFYSTVATYMTYILGALLIYLTSTYGENQTVPYALMIATAAYLFLRAPLPLLDKIPFTKKLAWSAFLGLLLITASIAFLIYWAPLLPESFLAFIKDKGIYSTLESRMQLAKMTYLNLTQLSWSSTSLCQFLFGSGWGTYGNHVISNIFLDTDIRVFNGTTWAPSWEFINRDLLHSHNIFLEPFHAIGMIGTTIFVYGKYLIIRSMRKTDALPGTFFVILMGVLLVFWFQVPHLFPYTLLAMAILFSSGKKESLPQWVGTIKAWSLRFSLSRMTLMGSALLLCSMGLFHGITQYSYTQTFNKPDKTLDIKVSAFATSPLMDIDKLFGGVRHSALAGGLSGQVFKAIDQIKPDAPERPQHIQEGIRIQQQIIDALQQYPGSNMSALIQVTNIYAHLITNKNTAPYVRLIPDFVETWDSAIDLVLQHLPYRSDVLVPYLSMLTTSKRWKRLDDITTLLIKAKPNDPITLWFKGVYLIHSDYTYRDGMLMLKKSIQLGITRFMPLPQQELDRILNAEIDEND